MRAIFLDRDGVICRNRSDYVKNWQEFEFLPGAKDSLLTLSRLGLPVIVVTNQAVIGRGLAPTSAIDHIHSKMVAEITAFGGRIDKVLMCPHHPNDNCNCRKPRPGMLQQAAAEMGIDLSQSYMVGDAATDIMAGQHAGCTSFMVLTGRGLQQLGLAFQSVTRPFTIIQNLVEATNQILKVELRYADAVESGELYTEAYQQSIAYSTNNYPVSTI